MKLFYWSWFFGIQSYVILGVLRRSGWLVAGAPLATAALITLLLLLLSAATGVVLGVVSGKRREVNAWWAVGSIALNVIMAIGGVMLVMAD